MNYINKVACARSANAATQINEKKEESGKEREGKGQEWEGKKEEENAREGKGKESDGRTGKEGERRGATRPRVAPRRVLRPARRGVRAGKVPETQGACVKVGVQRLQRVTQPRLGKAPTYFSEYLVGGAH